MTRVVLLVDPSRRAGSELAHVVRIARSLGDVCALSVAASTDADEAALRSVLAAGAQRAIALWDGQLESTDYYGTAQALAAATRKLGYDVVVCADGRRGLIGPALADQLGIPHLASVIAAEARDGRILARRAGWSTVQAFSAAPPLLLSIAAPAVGEPLPEVAASAEVRVDRLTLADVGISPAEVRWRKRFAPRPAPAAPEPRPRVFKAPAELAARLVADGLIAPPSGATATAPKTGVGAGGEGSG